MTYTKEQYEELINHSILFTIDKEKDHTVYKTERAKFLKNLTDYFSQYVMSHKSLSEYGYELMITANECIMYYDRSKGLFLNLFNHAFKQKRLQSKAKELEEEKRGGIHLPRVERAKLKKILQLVKSKNLDIKDFGVQQKVAKVMGISMEHLLDLLSMNQNTITISETTTNDDGEEISIFDTFASREKSVEHCVLAEESFLEQLNKIEKAFLLGQNRAESKRLLSMLLTALLLDVKQEDIEYVSNLLQKYTFISKELIELVRKLNKKLTNREIAVICGTSEQNASRALKKFRDKLKENG